MEVKAEISFKELALLGENGWNSQVYLGFDEQLGVELAFKKIEKSKCSDPANFFEEAKAVQASQHSNVVEIKYACQDADSIWLAMPYYPKGSVQALMNRRALTPREVIKIGIAMLTGLQHVHFKKRIHLDIKPANILLKDCGDAVLSDFGCARPVDENMLADPLSIYPLHQVPERFKGSKLGPEADIYMAGLTLYRMANGDDLFYESVGGRKTPGDIKDNKVRNKVNDKIKAGKLPDRTLFLPHVPRKLRSAIGTALAVNPDDRFKTPAEFIEELSQVDSSLDWLFDNHLGTWSREDDEKRLEIILSQPNAKGVLDVSTWKTIKASGNKMRSSAHSKQFAKLAEAQKFVAGVASEIG